MVHGRVCIIPSSIALNTQNRLGRGHCHLGERRLDDAIQATLSDNAGEPWQVAAQNREASQSLEVASIARVTRMRPSRVEAVPRNATRSQSRFHPKYRDGQTQSAGLDANELPHRNSEFAPSSSHANSSDQMHWAEHTGTRRAAMREASTRSPPSPNLITRRVAVLVCVYIPGAFSSASGTSGVGSCRGASGWKGREPTAVPRASLFGPNSRRSRRVVGGRSPADNGPLGPPGQPLGVQAARGSTPPRRTSPELLRKRERHQDTDADIGTGTDKDTDKDNETDSDTDTYACACEGACACACVGMAQLGSGGVPVQLLDHHHNFGESRRISPERGQTRSTSTARVPIWAEVRPSRPTSP